MNSLPPAALPRYVIISPVKDEERYVEHTLRSVTSQTMKPVLWLIVDDGSNDSTPDIIRRYIANNSFIRMVRNPRAGIRQPGSAVMRAFNYGLQFVKGTDYDFIVKLDCDVSLEPDYFEIILHRFVADYRLGIASGVYLEIGLDGLWNEIKMPSYHAAGACKVVSQKCFQDIGGFFVSAGWDTVDEVRAITRGWKTIHFKELKMKHHKPEGSGIGVIKTSVMHGEIYYLTGGSPFFFLFKAIRRFIEKPYGLNAIAMVWGFMRSVLYRKPRLVNQREASCYRKLLNERLREQMKFLSERRS